MGIEKWNIKVCEKYKRRLIFLIQSCIRPVLVRDRKKSCRRQLILIPIVNLTVIYVEKSISISQGAF
jgi:hypothetical protein